jgi:predicted amidophosphoribosyltransferase
MDAEKTWPPAPAVAAEVGDPAVKFCPNCGRKLLTQTSALCNWCGAKIEDDDYQERAAKTRLERDVADRAAVEAVMQEEAAFGVLGRLKRKAKLKAPNELKP